MITGRCECGAITYEIDGEIEDYSHCHCGQCRRLHGAAFGSYGGVKRSNFRFITGADNVAVYSSSPKNDRWFCNTCGSTLLVAPAPEPDVFYVTLGTMDGDPPRPPGYHIYVGSKADWWDIDDDLPQHEEEPGQWPPPSAD